MDKRRGRCCLSEDIEGRHHTGMQHTIGGLTDHIINKEIHHWLAVPATSLTELSHTAHRCRLAERHKHTITEQLMTGKGGGHTKPKGPFWWWESFFATLTTGEGFIRAVTAVSPSITVPVGGDAAATRATELALGTCGFSYGEDAESHEISFYF